MRDELVVAAVAATQPQETMRQDAALKKGPELVLHELRQAGDRGGVDLGEEGRDVLLHQAVKRGLLGAVALVVNRGAIGRPVGLPTDGLHASLTSRLWLFTVSDGAAPRHHTEWGLPCDAHLRART